MKLTDISRKPNVLILITDQEREVMHWPDGWAEANLPARRRLMANGLHFTRAQCNTAACSSVSDAPGSCRAVCRTWRR
jgi:arylsulfatase A-like enzyme